MPSPVDRVRFSRFVDRALAAAHAKGMTSVQIEEATGIRASTYHRWRRGEVAPTIDKVRQFCAGLGIPANEALAALGVGPRSEPEPTPMDPDIVILLRKLSDPATNPETKTYIRRTLRALAAAADETPARPRKRRAG